jgi:hypothetical protein
MRVVASLALLLLPTTSVVAHAAVEVRQDAGRVSVRADAAPLSEVLDRLSKQLGMKVVYEGAPPRVLISAALENRTPAQAVLGVLEGTGVDYLARMDRAATRVDTLIVSSSGSAPGAATAAAPHAATQPPAPGRALAPVNEEESDDEQDQPVEELPPTARPGQGNPGDETDPQRPRPGAGPLIGRPPNAPGMPGLPGMPANQAPGAGAGPGALAPGSVGQPSFPVSPFAPVPPPPTTLPAPPPPSPAQGDDSEEQ